MAEKTDEHKVKLTGPGLSLDQLVSKEIANRIINLVMTGAATASTETEVDAGSSKDQLGGIANTPKDFISRKKPSNDYERVACLAYYLTHKNNLPQFKTMDITNLGTKAALDLSNTSQAVMHATATYHYLAKAGGGKKQITHLGEAVVEALPDREKVKLVIAEHKPKRRKRRQTKRK